MAKRSVASATISFGLVAIPVKFYMTASADNVSFNMITDKGNRVKQLLVDAVTDAEVDRAKTKKGYEYAKGKWVVFTQEELKSLGDGENNGTMEIVEFVPAASLDPMQVEKTYYVDAAKGGDKTYRLFAAALKDRNVLAVAQWTRGGRQHLMMIGLRGDVLIAHQMFYAAEVREFELDCAKFNAPEAQVKMAGQLIDALTSTEYDGSKYVNSYNERVKKIVDQKLAGETFTPGVEEEAKPAGDLMAALEASIKAAKAG